MAEEKGTYDDLLSGPGKVSDDYSDLLSDEKPSLFEQTFGTRKKFEGDTRNVIGMMVGAGAGGAVFKGLQKPLLAMGVKWFPRAVIKSALSGAAAGGTEAAITGRDIKKGAGVGAAVGGALPVAGAGVRAGLPRATKLAKGALETAVGRTLQLLPKETQERVAFQMAKEYARWHELISSGEVAISKLASPELANKFKELRAEWSINAGKKIDDYVQSVSGLNHYERHAVAALREQRLRPQDLVGLVRPNKVQEVQNAANTLGGILDDIRTRAVALNLPMRGSDDDLYDFVGLDNYYPHRIVNTKHYLEGGLHNKAAVKAVIRANVTKRDIATSKIESLRTERTKIGERVAAGKQALNVGRKQIQDIQRQINRAEREYGPDAAAARIASLRKTQADIRSAIKSIQITPEKAFKERRALSRAIKAQQRIVEDNRITTPEEANKWLRDLHEQSQVELKDPFSNQNLGSRGMASSHLRARAIGLPGYELDPDLVIPQYIEHMERRLALTQAFGPKAAPVDPISGKPLPGEPQDLPEGPEGTSLVNLFPGAYETIQKMPDGPIKQSAKVVMDRLLGHGYQPSGLWNAIGGKANVVMNSQTISRLTFSALNQPSQITMGGAVHGHWRNLVNNTLKTMYRDPEVAEVSRRSAATLQGVVRQANMELMGMTTGATSRAAQSRLQQVGMPQMDLAARAVGALQGQTAAQYASRELMEASKMLAGPLNAAQREFYSGRVAKIGEKLNQLGIKPQEVLAQHGKLSDDQLLRAANSSAFEINFWGDALSLPGFFASPEARFLLQFKSFVAQNTILIKNRFVKPAMKWVATGGKEGEIEPLLRLVAVQGAFGESVSNLKAFLMNKERPTSVKERVIEDLAQGGLLGPVSDAMYAVNRGYEGIIAALAGPSVTTMAKAADAAYQLGRGKPEAAQRFITRDVLPMAGPGAALVAPAIGNATVPGGKTKPIVRLRDVPNPFAQPDTTSF